MTTVTAPASSPVVTTGRRTRPSAHARATGHRGRHEQAAHDAVEANSTCLEFHLGDTDVQVTLPPLDKLAFYAGLAGAVAFGVLDWPIAVVTGVGHLLSDDRHNRMLRALGEALDAA
jgi:hypothetical protein